MLEFLPKTIRNALSNLNMEYVYEIRIRADMPICVNYKGRYQYLGFYGLVERQEHAVYATLEDITECVYRAGKCSLYSVEEEIKQGFITAQGGVRIGLSGEYVFSNGKPVTIRNFSSLCIRIPHEVVGCGDKIYQCCMSDRVQSLLIMSSPGIGKTTILRDLCRTLSMKTKKNILICDERDEIAVGHVGESWDVMKYADKATAFEAGIRAMRPDIIVTDEISATDLQALRLAVRAGVCIIASAHIASFSEVSSEFLPIFSRFVLLNSKEIGKIQGIYDREGRDIS